MCPIIIDSLQNQRGKIKMVLNEWKIGVRFGKSDGLGKWNNHHLNQGHLQKGHLCLRPVAGIAGEIDTFFALEGARMSQVQRAQLWMDENHFAPWLTTLLGIYHPINSDTRGLLLRETDFATIHRSQINPNGTPEEPPPGCRPSNRLDSRNRLESTWVPGSTLHFVHSSGPRVGLVWVQRLQRARFWFV